MIFPVRTAFLYSCCKTQYWYTPFDARAQRALVLPFLDILPLVSLRLASTQREVHFQQVLVVEI